MSQNDALFEICIAYIKDRENMSQAQYIRDKLGECTGGMQVEFSKFVQAAKPEWQEMAEKFRASGKPPLFAKGTYKEAVFRKAVALWDHQNEMDEEAEDPQQEKIVRKASGTKRKSSNRPKTTRASRNTRGNKSNIKVNEERPSPPSPDAKRRKTWHSPGNKKGKSMDTNDSPNFEAMEDSLHLLTGGLHQVQLHYNSTRCALAEARAANKELKKGKLAFEVEFENFSESLEEEYASLVQLKAENKKLRDESAKRANATDALARKSAANKKLKQENATLKIALETTKEEHNEKLSKQTESLDDQLETNRKLQEQIATLRSDLEHIGKLHCRTMESFSVQTKLLHEQCKTRVSPEATSGELKIPTVDDDDIRSKTSDKAYHKARRICL